MQRASFRKILIANRGEIALRIMRTCRAMGIMTVGVYSDADARAPHVCFADEAVRLGPPPSRESYLNIKAVIEAAKRTGAEAIHPGYGFLSENAEFAEACEIAGIVFIGPAPAAIRRMGLKSVARQLADEAGVPTVSGYDGEDQSIEAFREQVRRIGLPVLIKASAGGGGKGMRVLRSEDEMVEHIQSARREAEAAFGNGSLLLEKYIEGARHIEVQLLGDQHGNLIHLFERDCSLQRRHQKVIEECPSPAVDDLLRKNICEAALKVGRAICYSNAGTVEFIVSPGGEFYFIEVNTRLQVEHPVTEMGTGLDLVRLQIESAEGAPLSLRQQEVRLHGASIEARLYAEDPANDFLPSTGRLLEWKLPAGIDGLRIDAGVEAGSEIGIFYDSMLAKLVATADTREAAIRKLINALGRLSLAGLRTNRDFLVQLLEDPDFLAGRAHTGTIGEKLERLVRESDRLPEEHALMAAAIYLQIQSQTADEFLRELPAAYRNNPYRDPSIRFQSGGIERVVSYRPLSESAFQVGLGDATVAVEVIHCPLGGIRIAIDGLQREYRIVESGLTISIQSATGSRLIHRLPRYPARQGMAEKGSAMSPMPGLVQRLLIEPGQRVSLGDPLLILEAMKMEHTMRAAQDGIVTAVLVRQGEVVGPGQLLIQIDVQ
jgi:3-methylcrotonyl-CoA carboxylase alpha subunit